MPPSQAGRNGGKRLPSVEANDNVDLLAGGGRDGVGEEVVEEVGRDHLPARNQTTLPTRQRRPTLPCTSETTAARPAQAPSPPTSNAIGSARIGKMSSCRTTNESHTRARERSARATLPTSPTDCCEDAKPGVGRAWGPALLGRGGGVQKTYEVDSLDGKVGVDAQLALNVLDVGGGHFAKWWW